MKTASKEFGISLCKALGRALRNARKQKGYSQEDFAQRCGLGRTYISDIERGLRNVSVINVGIIAVALGLSLPEFVSSIEMARDEANG